MRDRQINALSQIYTGFERFWSFHYDPQTNLDLLRQSYVGWRGEMTKGKGLLAVYYRVRPGEGVTL